MQTLARWIWTSGAPLARLARLPLAGPAASVALALRARAAAYRHGWLRRRALPAPSVSVGNLTVGGAGKTPVASWIAGYYARRGLRAGILLRGGAWGDEAMVHRRLMPGTVVVEGADRVEGAARAVEAGAQVLVLDDAFQRLDVKRDLDILLIAADSFIEPRVFPAGPWREGLDAAARADLIVITRKQASLACVRAVARCMQRLAPRTPVAVASINIAGFEPLSGGRVLPPGALTGSAVIASSGIAEPASFAAQLRALGARVSQITWPDHHRYRPRDIAVIASAGRAAHRVVVTEKDAVKLRGRWPRSEREPLVARVQVEWDEGLRLVTTALDHTLN